MASFNLGRIKGDTGPKGDSGEKGDTGAKGDKGDKGDKGERGTDGYTPVFSVASVETLPSSQNANVEVNTDDIKNPKLSFYIPRGKDGKDGAGDMQKAIYDTEGKNQDFFVFAQQLFEKCIKTDGGNLVGKLTAYEAKPSVRCLRNVIITENFPDDAAEGDLCIRTVPAKSKTLGDCNVGSVLLVTEGTETVEYLVVGKDIPVKDGITLVRRYLPNYQMCYDSLMRSRYLLSSIDVLLENTYRPLFSQKIQEKMMTVMIDTYVKRHCFLLSHTEIGQLEYFVNNGKLASNNSSGSPLTYLTRTTASNQTVYAVNYEGLFTTISQGAMSYFRPAFVLPKETIVENTEYKGQPAVKIPEEKAGIFVFEGGEWKECV